MLDHSIAAKMLCLFRFRTPYEDYLKQNNQNEYIFLLSKSSKTCNKLAINNRIPGS